MVQMDLLLRGKCSTLTLRGWQVQRLAGGMAEVVVAVTVAVAGGMGKVVVALAVAGAVAGRMGDRGMVVAVAVAAWPHGRGRLASAGRVARWPGGAPGVKVEDIG